MAFRTNKVPAIEERSVSGSSVSFNSAFALPLKACKVSFSATQAGSGDPSPSNPRAISGVSAIGLTANSTPVSISLGEERYGGELDVLNGVLRLSHYGVKIADLSINRTNFSGVYVFVPAMPYSKANGIINIKCECYKTDNAGSVSGMSDLAIKGNPNANTVYIRDDSFTSVESFKSGMGNYLIYYELATPQIIQLSANELSSIIGNNTFSTDTGTLEITFADLQEKSASGAVATFNTALAMPLSSCNIAVNAWQEGSGDPSPVNNRPIHGFSEVNATRAGKNLLNPNSEIYYHYTINDDGSENTGEANKRICTDYLPCKPSTKYVVSGGIKATTDYLFQFIEIVFYDRNKNYISREARTYYNFSLVATSPINAAYLRIGELNNQNLVGTITPAYFSEYQRQLEIGETATDYAPFVAFDTYTIQLGQEVYGAEVDVDNGVLRVTSEIVDMGDINWTYLATSSTYFFYGRSRTVKTSSTGTVAPNMLADIYKTTSANTLRYNTDYMVSCGYAGYYAGFLLVKNPDYTDATLFKQDMANHKICYELATPFDIQLTPTQIETIRGNNTIFADTGDVDLTYKDLDIAKRGNFREVFKLPS